MLHHTIIPWSPERMRRLILSLIRSSGKAANVPKPTSVGITSSQIRIALASRGRAATLAISLSKRRQGPHLALIGLRPPVGSLHQYGIKPQRSGWTHLRSYDCGG